MNQQKPLVSICLITYNHEKFIHQALHGILMQKTSFPFEIIISNDLSTDSTEKIALKYEETDDRIRYYNTKRQLGVIGNWIKCLELANGKYVSVIEGDDFWTDSSKLQKQFDFLEQNPKYSFCFHKLKMIFDRENDKEQYLFQDLTESVYSIEDVLSKPWFIGTCSIFFRKSFLPHPFPNWVQGLKAIDKPLQLILGDIGPIGFINETLGVYRIHNNGISQINWLGKERLFEKSNITIYERFNNYSKRKYNSIIDPLICKYYLDLIKKNNDYKKDLTIIKLYFLYYRIKRKLY